MNTYLMEMREMYQAYVDEAQKIESQKRPLQAVVRGQERPADDLCHARFVEDMDRKTQAAAADQLPAEDVREIVNYIFSAPKMFREVEFVYWTMIAVQGAALCLIPLLEKEDAAELQKKFNRDFRRWQRLPVQKMVYKALEKQKK